MNQNYNNNIERELGWEDEITQENNFVLLQEGEYDFIVEKWERGRFAGSEKMPACNQATIHVKVFGNNGESTVIKHNLLLHTRTEWALSAFFASIGQKQKDMPLRMNWNLVTGARGRCKVGIKVYKDNQYNEIKKFIPSYEVNQTQTQTPTYQTGSF